MSNKGDEMIKVSVIDKGNIVTIQFESNDLASDQDKLDLIGEVIVGPYPKRGGYELETPQVMKIDALITEKVDS